MRRRLAELIIERSFRFSDKPAFRLASGRMSSYYFNCKPTTLNGEAMYLIGNIIYDIIRNRRSWPITAAGGLTLGADPIANAVAYTSYLKGDPIEAFVVRKEPKKHGTMLWIEGNVKKGDRIVIIEDVITTGGSALKAIDRARKSGLKIEGVVVLVDRQEGGREAIESRRVPVETVFAREEIMQIYGAGRQLPGR
jgi:orotate phosphoribosyltransferase